MRRAWIVLLAALIAALACTAAAEAVLDALPGTEAPAGDTAPAFDEESAGYEGVWVDFEDGFRLYLPAEWVYYEITDEQSETGLFYRAGNNGTGDASMGLAVSCAETEGIQDPQALAEAFAVAGFSAVSPVELNGIPAVSFENPEEDYRGVAFHHPTCSGYVMTVYVAPLGEPGNAMSRLGRAILSSLSPRAASDGE